uniref:NADH-ubiquinone oxidoreductase chain 1 n=1 Tax=Andrena chrysosceles TaxID=1411665 RepID=A0A0S2LSZ9_9HYME|nr:NADH dehydrogenase subunit 1 [Andrena chrysosceles]
MYSFIMYFFLNLIHLIGLILLMLIGMAFLTLFERKVLGYIQNRKGPNKVGVVGLLQPFSDVIKLLNKEFFFIDKMNLYLYYFSVVLILLLSMMVWLIYPFFLNIYSMKVGILFLLSVLSMGVYPIMIGGWASNSNYSMLGAIRSVSQSVSYEVSLFLTMFSVILLIESYSLLDLFKFQYYIKFILILVPIYLMFLISLLIELNRTPFDLVEGESELVSGFNTEYFGGSFALIFMAEYLSIIFMSFLISLMFMIFHLFSMKFLIVWLYHIFFIVWIRGVLPRMRYDELMYMCWKKFLSYALIYLMFIFGLKLFFQLLLS